MRLLFVQLALALFQIDLAVKHEMDEQPDGQPEQLLPGGVVGLKKLHNHGTAGRKICGTYAGDHSHQRCGDHCLHWIYDPIPRKTGGTDEENRLGISDRRCAFQSL